jgi:hypothetical protein
LASFHEVSIGSAAASSYARQTINSCYIHIAEMETTVALPKIIPPTKSLYRKNTAKHQPVSAPIL